MSERTHEVTLVWSDGTERTLRVAEDETILDAALKAEIDLPNSCCQGWCTTCAGRLLSGKVDHPWAMRYYGQDAAAGYVLLCSAEPRSDCRILTHQKQAIRKHRAEEGLPAPGG